jgi:DNA-binding CsgD family transcriptional regulator
MTRSSHFQQTILGLTSVIYEAAGDSARWPAFLQRLGDELGSTSNTFFVQDLQNQRASGTAVGIDPAFQESYKRHYLARNIYLTHGRKLLNEGRICRSEMLCPDRVAQKSEFFNEWIVPQKMNQHGLLAVILDSGSLRSMLGAIRESGSGEFGERHVYLVRTLMPHLQQAVRLYQRITELEARERIEADALNLWSLGVIVLDLRGRALLVNRRAEEILNQKDGLSLDATGLRGASSEDTRKVRGLINDAVGTTLGRGIRQAGGPLSLSRPSLKRPLNLLISPVPFASSRIPASNAACIVFVSDPETIVEPPSTLLCSLYGLTPAESNLAIALMRGESVSQAADRLGVSQNTARFHLKHIFEKTDTRRQGEFIRLVLSSPAQLVLR